jgi:YD repeat-containing protein
MVKVLLTVLAVIALMTASAAAQSRTQTNGPSTRYYDARGNSLGTSTTSGNTTTHYDSAGRVISRETRSGNTTTLYGPDGRTLGRSTTTPR